MKIADLDYDKNRADFHLADYEQLPRRPKNIYDLALSTQMGCVTDSQLCC
jgi:hypothetical protein